MRHHHSYLTLVRPLLLGACLAASSHVMAATINEEFDKLKKYVEYQNDHGYGKTVSSALKTLTILNKTGTNGIPNTYNIRRLGAKGDWSGDTSLPPGFSFTYNMADTAQISLNGDGSSDDIKINDVKGYVEYKSGQENGANIWANMVTWNSDKQMWLINSLFDTVGGAETVLLPSINGSDLMITLVDGHNYGTILSNTFTWTGLKNSTRRTFPLRYQTPAGEWIDADKLAPGQSKWFRTSGTREISLNGGGAGDDLKINDDLGYIEFNLGTATGSLFGIGIKSKKIWVTQAWFHPTLNRWYGAGSWSSIDSGGSYPDTTLTPKFDLRDKSIIFELQDKFVGPFTP